MFSARVRRVLRVDLCRKARVDLLEPSDLARLERRLRVQRKQRARRTPPTLGSFFKAEHKAVKKMDARLAAVAAYWRQACPAMMRAVQTVSLRKNVLRVQMSNASTAFEFDRWIRADTETRRLAGANRVLVGHLRSRL